LEDLREADEEVEVDIYEESAPLTFTRSQQKVAIFEYQIVCDVQVTEDVKPAPKKRGAAAGPSFIKINRQQFNKVNRQMENAGKYWFPYGFNPLFIPLCRFFRKDTNCGILHNYFCGKSKFKLQ
jgi:hypothetical protein